MKLLLRFAALLLVPASPMAPWRSPAVAAPAAVAMPVPPALHPTAELPFHREVINRYSLNGRPRSLALRQGDDVWLGYDLEQAKPFRVWQAPAGKPGVLTTGFVARSAGTAWFDDAANDSWTLQRGGRTWPLIVRYLGCSQREDHFELGWELRHDAGRLKLRERIPRAGGSADQRVVRELCVESLGTDETLRLPAAAANAWAVSRDGVPSAAGLAGDGWHRVTLARAP